MAIWNCNKTFHAKPFMYKSKGQSMGFPIGTKNIWNNRLQNSGQENVIYGYKTIWSCKKTNAFYKDILSIETLVWRQINTKRLTSTIKSLIW